MLLCIRQCWMPLAKVGWREVRILLSTFLGRWNLSMRKHTTSFASHLFDSTQPSFSSCRNVVRMAMPRGHTKSLLKWSSSQRKVVMKISCQIPLPTIMQSTARPILWAHSRKRRRHSKWLFMPSNPFAFHLPTNPIALRMRFLSRRVIVCCRWAMFATRL